MSYTKPNFIVVATVLVSLTSLYSCFKTSGIAQKITLGLTTGTGCIALSASVISSAKAKELTREVDKIKADCNRELTLKSRDLTTLKEKFETEIKTRTELESQLKNTRIELEVLVVETTELNRLLVESKKQYREKVEDNDIRLEEQLTKFQKCMVNGLYDYLSVSMDILLNDVDYKLNDERFTLLHLALQKKQDMLLKATEDFNLQLQNLHNLPPDDYEKLAKGFLNTAKQLGDLRVGYRALLNRQTRYTLDEKMQVLEEILTSSVPIESANHKISEVKTLTRELLQEYHQCQQQKLEVLYLSVSESSEALQELDTIAKSYLSEIDKLQNQVQLLQGKVTELEQPLKFYGSSAIAVAGNSINLFYFKNYGYRLDALNWLETDIGYELMYATRNNPGLSAKELYQGNAREQLAAFTNALRGTLPCFEFNYQNCTLSLKVQLRHQIKKVNTCEEIDKIWVPASKFESYVRRWERIRVTAGSTGGKSPTAKNLALAIMQCRNGEGVIRLYDPQHGSKKDFWKMPKAGVSHQDNVVGMRLLNQLLDDRTKNPQNNHPFTLFIFDELDSTIAKFKGKDCKFSDLVNYSLKQASHQNIGCIYIGQSADANEIPGMSWSDWASAVQLHIGSNATIYIDKAQALTTEDKNRLREQYRKLQDYCDFRNEELGLDVFTDPGAYRFALAVPLTGLPKFIQLPDFDTYDYDTVMSINIQTLLFSNSIDKPLKPDESVESKPDIVCPHCNSLDVHKNGFNTKNQQYYSCKSCDCKPRKWLIKNSTNSI